MFIPYTVHIYVVNAMSKLHKTCDLWTTGNSEDVHQVTLNCAHRGSYNFDALRSIMLQMARHCFWSNVFFRYHSHNQTNMAASSRLKLSSL